MEAHVLERDGDNQNFPNSEYAKETNESNDTNGDGETDLLFSVGDFVLFRGTDGIDFNIVKIAVPV